MTAILALLLACGGGSTVAIDATPKPVEGAECEVCGMTVRDQPSPWAEVLHRDGERAFLCSVADLRAYLQNPSAHGKPVEVWVQALPADYDPSSAVGSDTYPWIPAADAVFVVGVARTGVMGVPALSYANRSIAEQAAAKYGGHVVTWAAIEDSPFNETPEE